MGYLQPYKFYTKAELFAMLQRQAEDYSYTQKEIIELNNIVFDSRWDPIKDFDGCTVIQDKHHPYLPCFVHDYRWIIGDGGIASDREFYRNLIRCGTPIWRALLMFWGVRLAWLLWFKWTTKNA